MNSKANSIIVQIKELLDELSSLSVGPAHVSKNVKNKARTKGASGALSILIDEGFFNQPRELPLVLNKLKEVGRYYSRQLVAMNLLNLVKKRVLTRIKEAGSKSWNYVIRK